MNDCSLIAFFFTLSDSFGDEILESEFWFHTSSIFTGPVELRPTRDQRRRPVHVHLKQSEKAQENIRGGDSWMSL